MKWANVARQTILDVFKANPEADMATMTKLVNDAYPFGAREHWPYKAWLKARKGLLDARFPERRGWPVGTPPETGLFSEGGA